MVAALLFLGVNVSAVDVDGISVVVPSSIEAGENFDVDITLENPDDTDTAEFDIEIYVEDVLVHEEEDYSIGLVDGDDETFTINSNNFETDDGDVWDKNLMAYACNDNVEVLVVLSGDIDWEDSDDIDIEPDGDKELSYDLEPSSFALDEEFKVIVYDEDDDELSGVSVKLTWIDDTSGDEAGAWDIEDDYEAENTDSDGEAEFRLSRDIGRDAYGMYQVDIWDDGYCKITSTLDMRNILNVTDPVPANPKVGEPFKVKVLDQSGDPAVGLTAVLSPTTARSTVTLDGEVTFTVDAPGKYSIVVGGTGTPYEETIKTIDVSVRPPLSVTVSPDPQAVGSEVTITVTSDGDPVEGATVKVMRVGGAEQTLPGTTSSSGAIRYTPTESSDYTVKVSKTGYEDGTEAFTARNSFQVDLPPSSELKRGNELSITVRDQSGNAVSGASVSLEGRSLGLTDSSGGLSFILENVGSMELTVTKNGFMDRTLSLRSQGSLQVTLDRAEITLGESVTITVTNSDGEPVQASIKVTGPAGSETHMASEYTLTPNSAGEYAVEASKPDYELGTASLTVKPKPLTLTYYFQGDQLILNASSNGAPVENLRINVKADGLDEAVVTDASGMAAVAANASGNYTITVSDPNYAGTSVSAVRSELIPAGLLIPLIIVLVAVVLIAIFAVVLIYLLRRRQGPKTKFTRTGGSRLGG